MWCAADEPLWRWREPTSGKPHAVTLVIHGLNLKPAKMAAFEDVLLSQNSSVISVSLTGHRGATSLEDFRKVTAPIWVREVREAFAEASARARRPGTERLPLFCFGYSLGGAYMQKKV